MQKLFENVPREQLEAFKSQLGSGKKVSATSFSIRGYDFPWISGHPQESVLKDILQKTLGDSTTKALDKIEMEKSTLSNMYKGKALSEEHFNYVNEALDNYKQKINKVIEHNTPVYGSDGNVSYKPDFTVRIDDEGHFINQGTGELVREGKLGRGTFKTTPDTSETNIEKAQQDYHQRTESHNTQTSNPPPNPPNSKPSEPKTKVKDTIPPSNAPKVGVPDTVKASNFLKANRGKIIAGAAGLGIAKAVIDGDDDDLLSTAGKSIKTATVVGGLSYGAEHLLKTQTVQDLVRGEASDISKSLRKSGDMKRKATFKAGKIGTALQIGLGLVGTATVLDVGQRYMDSREAEKMKREQEFRIKQKEKQKRKKQKENAYGAMDTGQLVLDLFDVRTGHHKMGNAKFY